MEVVRTDVLVIGAGIAGLRAAATAREAGVQVTLVCKGSIGRSGNSFRASGGFAAAVGQHDSVQQHQLDFMQGGYNVNHPDLYRLVADNAPTLLQRLSKQVSGFESNRHGLVGRLVPAHSHARSVQYQDGMAELLRQLCAQLSVMQVEAWSNLQAIELARNDHGEICGAYFFDRCRSGVLLCLAGAVVMASGGCGRLFPVTSNCPEATGDGYALALAANCQLRDMEFIQFTPTAFAAPAGVRGQTIVGSLLTLPGIRLLNANGDRFMQHYDSARLEQADRATLARAIAMETASGRGTDAGGVYLDLTSVDAVELDRHRPGFFKFCLDAGVDPRNTMLETAPSAHTCLGGIDVDVQLQATKGLYVCGEALGGTHGANRLSSNSLTEALVTGVFAGSHAAASCVQRSVAGSPAILQQPHDGGIDLAGTRAALINLMGQSAGVERSGETIEAALSTLSNLSAEIAAAGDYGVTDKAHWYELRNMTMVARAILISALTRQESRGAHYRTDFSQRDDQNWLGNVVVKGGADMTVKFEPLSEFVK